MKSKPEPLTGPEAAAAFDALVRKVLSVPHDEMVRREAKWHRANANKPKRGPKPKHSKG